MHENLRHFALAILLCGYSSTLSEAAEIPGSVFSYGNWSGSGFTHDDGTQQFSHCAVSASYVSGDALFFSINADVTVSIGLANETWTLQPGQTMPVVISIDQRAPFYGTAEAVTPVFAALKLPEFQRALSAIQKGYTMTITSSGWRGVYDLTGTFRALEEAKRCVLRFLDYPQLAAPQPGGPAGTPAIGTGPGEAQGTAAAAPVDPAFLYQLATVMITETGVPDFNYLTEQEKASVGILPGAVFWTSESMGVVGGVSATRIGYGADLSALGAAEFQALAQECPGDVVTGSRAVSEASLPGREIRAACSAGAESYEIYLTKTLIEDVLVEVFLFFPTRATEGPVRSNQEISENVRIRTANYVADTLN